MNLPTPDFILNRQVELLYRNLRLGQVASIVNASFLLWIAYGHVSSPALIAWWLAASLVAEGLGIAGYLFDHRNPAAACDELRRRLL